MADSPTRRQQSYQQSRASSSTVSDMAMLTAAPTAHMGFRKEYPWDAAPIPSLPSLPSLSSFSSTPSSRPLPPHAAHQPSRVVLPPIRSAIPALLEKPLETASRSVETSPNATSYGGVLTSPTYVHSPVLSYKRKREGGREEDDLDRARQIPRLHSGFESTILQPPASPPRNRASESWPAPMYHAQLSPLSRGSVHESQDLRAPPPPPMASRSAAMSPRERAHTAVRPPTRDSSYAEDYRDYQPAAAASNPPPPHHRYGPPPSPAYEYPPYRHHSHLPPLTTPSTTPASPTYRVSSYERTPFSSAAPYYYHDSRYRDMNGMSLVGDGKGPRKRRGNLPKETTDKLRAWFMAHLTHPYPTEDEKQELMRQTGLQMNQISNWFINARRRQLPAMISNARVETDATSGRGAESSILPSTERHEMHHGSSRSLALSDGEGAGHGLYDDDVESLSGKRSAIKRGSV